MPGRIEKRLVIALPVRVYGLGIDGKPFNQEAHTLDITRDGARIDGLPPIRVGDTLGVQYAEEKARYKVVWAEEPNANKQCMIGVQVLQLGGVAPWHKILDATPEEERWSDTGRHRDPFSIGPVKTQAAPAAPAGAGSAGTSAASAEPAIPTTPPPAPAVTISQRVAQATDELQALETMIGSGAV